MIKAKYDDLLDPNGIDGKLSSLAYDVKMIMAVNQDLKPYEVTKIDVLRHQWECDGYAWLVTDVDGNNRLFTTSHGALMEIDVGSLMERLSYYGKVVAETELVIKAMEG